MLPVPTPRGGYAAGWFVACGELWMPRRRGGWVAVSVILSTVRRITRTGSGGSTDTHAGASARRLKDRLNPLAGVHKGPVTWADLTSIVQVCWSATVVSIYVRLDWVRRYMPESQSADSGSFTGSHRASFPASP
jgi:hypothetical protein